MLEVITTSISSLVPHPNNARTHSKKQVGQIANSIKQFGFVNPVLADENGCVIAGHGGLLGASTLGLSIRRRAANGGGGARAAGKRQTVAAR